MATVSEPQRGGGATPSFTRSLRFRLTASFVILLSTATAVLLVFLNIAARLESAPVYDVPSTTSGFTITPNVVAAAQAAVRDDTLNQLHLLSAVAFVLLLLAAFAIGSYTAGRALQPISQIAAVARRISGRNLKERIDLVGPDDELKELAESFDAMVGRLDAAFEQQRQFIADASHELRTPLTALQLSLDDVRSDPDATTQDYRAVADQAAATTVRIRRLIEDLLALAESEQPSAFDHVDVASLVESVVEELEPVAARAGVSLLSTVPGGIVTIGDPLALRRAVTNLVDNGVRYSQNGGHVVVEEVPSHPGYLTVAVRDDGVGIPTEHLPHIFDRFYRVDRSRSRSAGGSGLGLSIVAKIVQEHGGRLDVESQPGEGTRFLLTLRRA